MNYLLYTDSCISIVRGVRHVSNRYTQNLGSLFLSAATVTNLEMWVLRPRAPHYYGHGCLSFLQSVAIIDVNEPIAHRAAMLGSQLRLQGIREDLPIS
jgi:predicted nucleic acid-binding protein